MHVVHAWFQSTPPREGRHRRSGRRLCRHDSGFNPRPRVRGDHRCGSATRRSCDGFNPRPRVRGDDRRHRLERGLPTTFQSTPPREGRPRVLMAGSAATCFNPRPCVRGDSLRRSATGPQRVRVQSFANRVPRSGVQCEFSPRCFPQVELPKECYDRSRTCRDSVRAYRFASDNQRAFHIVGGSSSRGVPPDALEIEPEEVKADAVKCRVDESAAVGRGRPPTGPGRPSAQRRRTAPAGRSRGRPLPRVADVAALGVVV